MTTSPCPLVLRRFPTGIWLIFGLLLLLPRLSADISIATETPGNPVLPRQYAPGSSVKFITVVSDPTATYQWLHDGVAIAGATTPSLTLTNLAAADTGNYQLRATTGSSVSLSNTLTVNVLPLPPSSVDLSFTSQLPASTSTFSSTPFILLVAPDGSSYVRNNDGTANPPILHLLADGSVDPLFTFPAAGALLAALPDGGLITSAAPYRLNADGSPRTLVLPAGFDSTRSLTAVAVQSDGKLLLAQGNVVARLNSDDSVDATFNYSSTLTSQHVVIGFTLDAAGRIYATATERDPMPFNFPSSWPVVYRLSATGAEDTAFRHQESPLRRGGIAVYPLGTGRLLRYANYEGIVYWAMLASDGSVDPSWSPGAPTIPSVVAVNPVSGRIFTLDYRGLHRALITATSLVDDPSFYPGDGIASSFQLTPSGQLLVSGNFTQWDGHASSRLIRLRTTDVTAVPPVANIGPGDVAPLKGSTQTFTSTVTGTGTFTYQWLALDGQPLPANSTSPTLDLVNFDTVNFGRYQLRVTWAGGSVLSNVTRAIYNPSQLPYLANLSGRAFVGTGDDTAIAGLAVKINAGALGISTLLRGAGPALQPYGITGFLPNPVLNLYSATGQILANNDTWGGTTALTSAATATGAFPFDPASNDAALQNTFYTGNTTLQLLDQAGGSGVGLLEIYRVPNPNVAGEITNLSLRARTGPGEKVAIAGFVIADPQGFGRSARVLLRVIGPTLSQYGVAFPLADPVLTLYDAHGNVVARNDNWSDTDPTGLAAAMQQVGAFSLPANSKDAAVLLDLPAGVYSVQATGATNATGVTLIEIYLVH